MPNLLSEFDLSEPGAPDALLERLKVLHTGRNTLYRALRATLDDAQAGQLHALLDAAESRELLQGARMTLLMHGTPGTGKLARVQDELKAERQARHEATQRAAAAEAKLARLERPAKTGFKPSPRDCPTPDAGRPLDGLERAFTPDDAPPPTWDYAPAERRRPKRGEVITSDPFGVEVVARQVEAFVTRHGECVKPDVSAALSPDVRGLLSQAYAHLHASRRVHVDGWRLSTWPHGERA